MTNLTGEGQADWPEPGLTAGGYLTGKAPPLPDESLLRCVVNAADLVVRGINATTVRNMFGPYPPSGE
ncbi:MAG TPA: hypothetical protein VEJ84_15890 [Acidimicrobiales bacterium]|nr:hypothetical protein [Acidimicrobiales bacterium]